MEQVVVGKLGIGSWAPLVTGLKGKAKRGRAILEIPKSIMVRLYERR
jgi:hypothetical protein